MRGPIQARTRSKWPKGHLKWRLIRITQIEVVAFIRNNGKMTSKGNSKIIRAIPPIAGTESSRPHSQEHLLGQCPVKL